MGTTIGEGTSSARASRRRRERSSALAQPRLGLDRGVARQRSRVDRERHNVLGQLQVGGARLLRLGHRERLAHHLGNDFWTRHARVPLDDGTHDGDQVDVLVRLLGTRRRRVLRGWSPPAPTCPGRRPPCRSADRRHRPCRRLPARGAPARTAPTRRPASRSDRVSPRPEYRRRSGRPRPPGTRRTHPMLFARPSTWSAARVRSPASI